MRSFDTFTGGENSRMAMLPPLRLGYVALNDALPLIIAKEHGIFEKYGLEVQLSREVGWATIRDKIEFGELDAAQALAPMAFAATLGLGNRHPMECVVSLILNLNGNAITLAKTLGANAKEHIQSLRKGDFSHRSFGKPTFAVVSEFSSHHILLRHWLKKNQINPGKDVHIVVLPPSQMPMVMANGHIDGFCAGEPWSTKAVANGSGVVAASSLDIDPGHVEKVLMVSHGFAKKRSESHIRLIAAMIEACELCRDVDFRLKQTSMLAGKKYLNCDEASVAVGLEGRISTQETSRLGVLSDQFLRFDDNRPSSKHSRWVLKHMRDAGLMQGVAFDDETISKIVFAEEYYESALKLRKQMAAGAVSFAPLVDAGV